MSKKVSSTDVARRAGVSRATVSYVLAGRTDLAIREVTRQKVFDAAEVLGYRPNLAARALVTGQTYMIALWVPYAYHIVFSNVIEHIMRLAQGSRFQVTIVQTYGETGETLTSGGLLSDWHVDGILAFDAKHLVEEVLGQHSHVMPIVSFGPAATQTTDNVGVDLYEGSLQALRHLEEIGCRRIAYVVGQNHFRVGEPRYDAYIQVMQEKGMEPLVIRLTRDGYNDAYQTVRHYFATQNRVDGLFCWNDETAIGANRALADLGLRVPEDVALIGVDGIEETIFSVPTLSTVAQPFEEMCRLAWDFLQQRLKDPSLPLQQINLSMRLEKRASTNRVDHERSA
ncbi:MAG: LacI family DNA-binding transcriptional regulator [Janthinobacterium lividum]